MGSLAALPLAFVVQLLGGNLVLMLVALALFGLGTLACNVYLKAYPEKEDPQEIVIDEVAAQCMLLAALFPTWQSYLVGFALFRLFDVVKPWPIHVADEKIGGGIGVMFDDLLAALYPILFLVIIWSLATALNAGHLIAGAMLFLGGA
jgi:phosphatidylglycerophosphatase A